LRDQHRLSSRRPLADKRFVSTPPAEPAPQMM
jgi:hypothetical protein